MRGKNQKLRNKNYQDYNNFVLNNNRRNETLG
jgi:hypothetical protein